MPDNNLIEQDHRGVKLRIGPMLGFKRFRTAAVTIAGIELLRRIHKGQFNLGSLHPKGLLAPASPLSQAPAPRGTTHPLGQTLIVTAGCGWVRREGGSVEEIRPGDVVWFLTR
jgi:DDE domain